VGKFEKGHQRAGGWKKGVPNVTTRISKELTEECYVKVTTTDQLIVCSGHAARSANVAI
jgi:hypothetical protein